VPRNADLGGGGPIPMVLGGVALPRVDAVWETRLVMTFAHDLPGRQPPHPTL
jgi:hypothetical protein